jgi:hypothetical protein
MNKCENNDFDQESLQSSRTIIDIPTTTSPTATVILPTIGDAAETFGRGIKGFFAALFHKNDDEKLETLERENKQLAANNEKAGKAAM